MSADALASKGAVVEEWVDLRFFRPLGMRVVRVLAPTRATPDQVTLWCLLVGLAGGHCFVYESPWVNALGFALLVVSDVLDSADGQLARLRGTSSPFGRILDGLSDSLRFANLYLHVLLRLVLHHGWGAPAATLLAVLALVSHSWQSAAVDCVRQAYLSLGVGRGGELDLPEDLEGGGPAAPHGPDAPNVFARAARAAYAVYVRRQLWLCPATVRLARLARRRPDVAARVRDDYAERQRGPVRQCAWIGQNVRWALVGAAGVLGVPAAFLWVALVPLNVVMVALLVVHERRSAAILDALAEPGEAPARAVMEAAHADGV